MSQDQDSIISDLISRVALGDRRAFDELYSLTSGRIFAVAMRIMKNTTEAEEICQDAFVRVWQRAETFRPGQARAMSWLTTIARNLAIDRIRAAKAPSVSVEMATEIPDGNPTPEGHVEATQVMHQIDLCLGELDYTHAGAVRAAYLDGYSYKELAAKFETPLNTMRTWLRRSLMRLKTCLERVKE